MCPGTVNLMFMIICLYTLLYIQHFAKILHQYNIGVLNYSSLIQYDQPEAQWQLRSFITLYQIATWLHEQIWVKQFLPGLYHALLANLFND